MPWDNGVTSPSNYSAPLLAFQGLGEIGDAYNRGNLSRQELEIGKQQQVLNQQRLAEGQRQAEASRLFRNGVPDNYTDMFKEFMKAGDYDNAAKIMPLVQQQQSANTPIYGPGAQPAAGAPQGQPQAAAPASIAARPLPPPAQNSPQGDSAGSVISRVTDTLPPNSDQVGKVAGNLAKYVGADPNAPLTAEQAQKADTWLKRYAQANKMAPAAAIAPAPDDSATFKDRFASAGEGGKLPPSANAVSAAPAASAAPAGAVRPPLAQPQPAQVPQQAQPAPIGAGSPQQGPAAAAGVPFPLNPFTGQPIPTPEAARNVVRALNLRMSELSALPANKSKVEILQHERDQIEEALKPRTIMPLQTTYGPDGKVLFQGAGAAAINGSNDGPPPPERVAAAQNFLKTGEMPRSLGPPYLAQAEAKAIRALATQMDIEAGNDPATLAERRQNFKIGATGKKVLEERSVKLRLAENEASALIPRVRDISDKISRTEYPTLNSLILASQKGTGDPNVIKYGLAVASLGPVYARVLKPTGQITEGDTTRALEILDKAWSKGQINAALDQMQLELDSAKQALEKTIDETYHRSVGGQGASEGKGAATASGGSTASTTTEWVRGPDGKLAPAK